MAARFFLFLLLANSFLACDLFDTRDFIPVGPLTVELGLLPDSSQTFSYAYEDRLRIRQGSDIRDSTVGEGMVYLRALGKDEAKDCLRIRRWSTGGSLRDRNDTVCLAQGDEGLVLTGFFGSGGMVLPHSDPAEESESGAWKLLPPGLEAGNQWRLVSGDRGIHRILAGKDTLEIDGLGVEAWRVDEVLALGGEPLSTGHFWFSGQGLERAEWEYPEFGLTTSRAEDQGPVAYERILRRKI